MRVAITGVLRAMKKTEQRLSVLLAILGPCLCSGAAMAAPSFTFTTLDDPSGFNGTRAQDVSGGVVVGWYQGYGTHGFLYNGSTYTTLDVPSAAPYGNTMAYGISGNNVVGVYGDVSQICHGFIYNGSTYTTLDDPLETGTSAGSGTYAYGISGNEVVGFYYNGGNEYAYLYNGSTYTTLNGPSGAFNTLACGISGNDIVGTCEDASGIHGFLYNGSTYTKLDDPSGIGNTWASGIFGGNIVGSYTDSSGKTHGFIYNGSTYTTLDDPLGTGGTYLSGISGGRMVGTYVDSSGSSHGFVASTPEPSTLALFGAGALGLLAYAWRRKRVSA